MRTIDFIAGLVLITAASPLWAAEPVSNAAPATPAVGLLELDPSGTPQSRAAPAALPPFQVQNGAAVRAVQNHGPIYVNDRIVTSADQTVALKLQDQSTITVAPSSDVTVVQFVNKGETHAAQISVEQGMVHLVVPKNIYSTQHPFMIRTKTATMGVRGTEFLVEQLPDAGSTLHTLDGSVAIGKTPADLTDPKSSRLVSEGQMSTFEKGATSPSEPKRFNRKTLFTYLGKRAPNVATQIEHQSHIRQHGKSAKKTATDGSAKEPDEKAKKKNKAWKRPRLRRQIGH